MKQEITNFITKVETGLSAHSPEILAGIGIVGSVAAIIFACKATTKAPKIIEDAKEELEEIREKEITEEYTEKDRGKELAKSYVKTGLILTKLYAPAIALEIVSLGSIWGSSDIYRKRNAGLTAALTAAETGFKRYRDNVIDRFGEDIDYELEHGLKKQEITTEEEDPETGKKKKVKKTVEVADPNRSGVWTKYFTRTNPYWDENSDGGRWNDSYLEMFFDMRAKELTNRLSSKRNSIKDPYVILNDGFEAFGFERETSAYVPCWKYDPKRGNLTCDISWRKVHIKNEDNQFEEAYAIDFRPLYNSTTGELLTA